MKNNARDAQKISFQSEKSEQIFLRFLNLFEEHFHSTIEIRLLASSSTPHEARAEGDQWSIPLFYEDQFLALVQVHNQRPGQKMEEVENFLELFLKPLLVSEFLNQDVQELRPEVWTLQSKSEVVAQDTAIILHDVTKRILYLPMDQLLDMNIQESALSETSVFAAQVESLSIEDQMQILNLLRQPAENTAFYLATRLSREGIKAADSILPEIKDLMLDRWIQVDVLPTQYRLRREALRLFVQNPVDVSEQTNSVATRGWDS